MLSLLLGWRNELGLANNSDSTQKLLDKELINLIHIDQYPEAAVLEKALT